MPDSHYYVIHSTEDGINIEEITRSELQDRLNHDYYGIQEFHLEVPQIDDGHFWSGVPGDKPWEKLLVIKGEIAIPKAVQHAIKYELD